MWNTNMMRGFRQRTTGSNLVSNGKTFDRNIKIVNAVTGVVMDSLSDEARKKKLLESGAVTEDILNMKDPYLELLEGIIEMGDYFPTKNYNVITSGRALLTLDEIKSGYYIGDERKFYSDNNVFSFTNEVRTYMPLLEIVRLLSLDHDVSLINKMDLLPFYREVEKIVYMTDEKNYPSYNKLPYNKEVVSKLIELKETIEKEDSWIFDIHQPEDIIFGEKNLGSLLGLIKDIDRHQEQSREASLARSNNQDIDIQDILKYKKRT